MGEEKKIREVSFSGELDLLVLSHRSVGIVFRSGNGARTIIRDRIAGLFVLGGRECLRTGTGLVIGLDQLEEVDGLRPSGIC